MDEFNKDITKMEYVYPELRVELYSKFKQTQKDIFRERKCLLEKLNNYDLSALTKSLVEKWIDESKSYNELAS